VAVAILAVLGLFVLDGVAAGVVLFVALLGFIGACIYAVRGEKVNDGVGGVGGPFAQ
jgi:multisubunit Na+/H+ antiporter MnhF subunit